MIFVFLLQMSDVWRVHFSKRYTVSELKDEKREELEKDFIQKLKVK